MSNEENEVLLLTPKFFFGEQYDHMLHYMMRMEASAGSKVAIVIDRTGPEPRLTWVTVVENSKTPTLFEQE
jgi:hypothetical protein